MPSPRRLRFSLRRSKLTNVAAVLAVSVGAALPALAEGYTASELPPGTDGYITPPANGVTVRIGARKDDAVKTVALPFEFPFFGRVQNDVTVCSNGWMAFGTTTATTKDNPQLPNVAVPNGVVAPLWDDLTTGENGSVRTFVTGTAPNRVFVVDWFKVDTFASGNRDVLSFQVQLREATGQIDLAYASDGVWDGLTYTAGIENGDGTVAVGGPNLLNDNRGKPAANIRMTPDVLSINGSVVRDRPVASQNGLNSTTPETGLPVVGTDVVAIREDTLEVAGRGRTRADGTYTISVVGGLSGGTCAVDLLASGSESFVTASSGVIYKHRIATAVPINDGASAGSFAFTTAVDGSNADIRPALNIQQAARRAFAFATSAAELAAGFDPAGVADTIPRLEFRYVRGGAATGAGTNYVAGTNPVVNVHDAADNPDPYDDDVIVRECGLHVLASLSVGAAAPSPRSFTATSSPDRAWADGFATWFACVVGNRALFIDTRSAVAANVFDIEAQPSLASRRPDVAGAVAAGLWDLVDPANETTDQFDGTAGEDPATALNVIAVIDRDLDALPTGTTSFNAQSFVNAWTARRTVPESQTTVRAFIGTGGLSDDTFEPNDTQSEAAVAGATGSTGAQLKGLTLNTLNEDWFSVDFSAVAEPRISASVVAPTSLTAVPTVFDVQLFAPDGGTIAQSLMASGSVTVGGIVGPPPGIYKVRVAWRSGPATSYTLTVRDDIRLNPSALPPWTAAESFKFDLGALGGIAPYTFDVSQRVPGLTFDADLDRLTGTPTQAGDYSVRVRVSDAASLGDAKLTDLNFHVNGPLRLPRFFGVPAGAAVNADVGSGGTDPVWTVGSAPANYTLTGGATLHLSGPPGAEGSIDVSGSATQSLPGGVSVPLSTSHVVFCHDLPTRGSADVPGGEFFGFSFDGAEGATANFRFRFRGEGSAPDLVAIACEDGALIEGVGTDPFPPLAAHSGYSVRLPSTTLRGTGRHYAIFRRPSQGAPFVGRVSVSGKVAAPLGTRGVVRIEALANESARDVVPVYVNLLGGSKVKIRLRAEQVPKPVFPSLVGVFAQSNPGVNLAADTAPSVSSGGRVVTLKFVVPSSGLYTVLVGGNPESGAVSGPLSYEVTPLRARQ